MKNIINISLLLSFLLLLGCNKNNNKTEIHQDSRSTIVDVSNRIEEIKVNLLLGNSRLLLIGNYIVLKDIQSLDKGIHLLNKNTLQYVASTGKRGKGPGEIVNYGQLLLVPDTPNNIFYAFDYAQLVVHKFSVDSILNNKEYLPEKLHTFSGTDMPGRMKSKNDSLLLGRGITIINNATFREQMSAYNLKSGELTPYGYENPELKTNKDSRAYFALSKKHKLFVNCYSNQDLMTICKEDGTLKCNVYGEKWMKNKRYQFSFFSGVGFYKDMIIASYNGDKASTLDKYKRLKGVFPTKFLVFNLDGVYLKTLETQHDISNFCVDEENDRLVIYFADLEDPLAYIDLTGILE